VTRDARTPTEPLGRPRPVVVASFFVMFAGALIAAGTVVWALAAPVGRSDHLVERVLCAGLGVALIGVAGKKFFWNATRSRRPRWQRASAVMVLVWAAYMVVLAIRTP
jgi:hypothetical protein